MSLLLLLAIPAIYYGLTYMHTPDLYEGDRLEVRTCRNCGGSGKDRELARECPQMGDRCPFCRGKGEVKVIIPGPNRPTRIWGAVVNAPVAGDSLHEISQRIRRISTPFSPAGSTEITGAIGGAVLAFCREGGETIETRTNSSGRFSKRIPPGRYTLKVTAPRFQVLEGEIEVKPLTEPIWLEKATLIQPCSAEEGQSAHGVNLIVGLSLDEDEEGFIRILSGWPH